MAWIYQSVFYVLLFQVSVRCYGIIQGPALQRYGRSTNQKSNGSYKIINRYGKPFVNKRVPVPDSSVVFPGLTSRSGDDFSLHIPDECKRIGICEDAPNIKDDIVRSVIKEFQRNNKSFSSDVLEAPQIAERIGPDEENVELCPSIERLYVPKLARDADKQWHRIINTDDNQQQKFRVEICTGNPNGPCSPVAIFQEGFEARCVQKYMLRHMVALNNNNEVIEKPFMLPSCCSCVARTV